MKKIKRITTVLMRFGSDPEKIEAPEEATVGDVLSEANMTLASNERVWVNGEKATRQDIVEDGDNIAIVSPKQAG